jgi:hypothetical protein
MSILTVLSIAGLYAIAGHRLRRLRATLGQAQSGNEFIEHRAWNNVGRLLVDRFDLRRQRAKQHGQDGIGLSCGDPILPQQAPKIGAQLSINFNSS